MSDSKVGSGVETNRDESVEIAAALTEAQRKALLYLPVDEWHGPAYWGVANTIRMLSKLDSALVESRDHPSRSQDYGSVKQWRLTPLGRAVLAALTTQEKPS